MKRNFLLMLLLTLLPFTVWAADPSKKTSDLVYTGSAQELVNAGNTSNYYYRYAVSTTSGKPTFSTIAAFNSGTSTSVPEMTDAGTYYVYWVRRHYSGVDLETWNSASSTQGVFEVKIKKATITPTLTPNAAVYNGEQNDLPGINVGGSTVFDGLDDGFGGKWAVTWTASSSTVSSWKNVGTYTVAVSNTNQEGTANFVVGKGTNYFTTEPTMAGWTFDPTCYAAPKAEPAGAAAKWGTVEFEYSDDNSTWTDYATAVGGMANTTGTPKYYVRAFVKADADGNYDRVESKVQDFVISKAKLSEGDWSAVFTAPAAVTTPLKWDGTAKALITEGEVKDAKAFTGATISYSYSPAGESSGIPGYSPTAAGNYEVKYSITGARNFDDYVSNDNVIAASIAQATNSVTDPTVADITYTGTPTPSSTATYGAIKYVYQKVGSDDPYTDAIAKFTAGDWNVKAVVAETTNYAGAESKPVTFNVAKAQFTVNSTLAAKLSMNYNGGEQSLLTGTIKKGTGMPDGSVTYTIGEETFGPIHSSDPSLVKKTNAGEYEVKWSVTAEDDDEAENWLPATGTINAEIAQAPLNLGLTPLTVDYGTDVTAEKIFSEVITSNEWVAGEGATDKMTILLNALTITTSKDGATAVDGLTPIVKSKPDAGVYTIALAEKDPMPGNYKVKLYSKSTTVTINKINATLAVLTPETPVYDGDAKALVTVGTPAVGGDVMYFVGDAAPDVKSTDWKAAIPEETTAGTYNVWQKVKGDDNHNDVVATAAVEVTIDKAPASAQVFTWTKTGGFVYGATPVIPEATALENAKIEYSYALKGSGTFGPAPATWTVGTWVVKAISAATTNYYGSSSDQEFTVTQAENKITNFAIIPWTYGEYDDVSNVPSADADFGEPTFTYSDSEDGPFTAEVPVNAGTWYVKASVAATDDYAATEQVISFQIEKAPVLVTDIVAPEPVQLLIFNGEAQTLVTAAKFADGIKKGTFKYSLDNATWADELPKGLNAGKYTVYTQFTPDANHDGPTVPSVEASIAKMELGYTLTTISNLTYTGKEVKYVDSKAYMLAKPNVLPGKDALEAPFKFQWPETVKDAKDYDFIELKVEWTNTDKPDFAENYTFKFTGHANFTIEPKELTEGMITVNPKSAPFTGDNVPAVTVAVADGDALVFGNKDAAKNDVNYTITKDGATFENGKFSAAGEYKFTFTAQNNYKGEVVVPFNVDGMSIANMLQMLDNTNWNAVTYNGKNQAPKFKLSYKKVVDGKEKEITPDYTLVISYKNAKNEDVEVNQDQVVDAHEYTFKFTGKGNYSGEIVKVKKINAKALKATDFAVTEKVEYTSKDQMPSIVAKSEIENLKEGKDYKVLLNGNEITKDTELPNFAATYVFSFVGQGNYNNTINKNFVIDPATVLITAGSYEKFYDGQVGLAYSELVEGDVAWTYSGLKDGDNITDNDVVVAPGALNVIGASKNANTYNLKVDASKFSVSDNYRFVAADTQGTLTIKKAPVTLGFKNVDDDEKPFYSVKKVYGEADSRDAILSKVIALENKEESPISAELVGLANTIVNSKTGLRAMNFHRTNAGVEEAGKYDEVVEIEYNEGVFGNYVVTTSAGNFEITEAPLTVALKNDIEVVYDGAYPAEKLAKIDASQLAISGMKWNDDYNVLKNVKGIIVDDKGNTIEPKDAGTYILKLTAEADDYNVTVLDSRLIITPAPLTITIADQTVYVNAKDEDLNMGAATIKGIVGSDDLKAKMVLNESTAAAGVFANGVKLTIDNPNYQIEKEAVEAAYGKLIVLAAVDIALDDAKAYTLPEKETTANVTFTTRVVNDDTWNVCVLPFETSPAEISDAFGYAAVDVLDDTRDDGNIHFQIVTSGVIPAGTPFIFKPSKDADDAVADFDEVTFKSVKIVKSFAAPVTVENGNTYVTDKAGNKFWGTFKSTSFYGKQYWYMSKGAWKDASKFTDAKPVTVKPFRAFVEFVTPAAGRIFIEEPDGTETAIDAIQFNQMVNGEATYTLDGKKVNNVTQKGIYIKDGKKVAVK